MIWIRNARLVQHLDIIDQQCDLSYYQNKEKNHVILADAEKGFNKIKHPFMMKNFLQIIEDTMLNLTKDVCEQLLVNLVHNSERLYACSLRWETKQGCPL